MDARWRCVPRLRGMDAERDAIGAGGVVRNSVDWVFVRGFVGLEFSWRWVFGNARQVGMEARCRCVLRLYGRDAELDAITVGRRGSGMCWAGSVCSRWRGCRCGAVAVVRCRLAAEVGWFVRVVVAQPPSAADTHCRSLLGWWLLVRRAVDTKNIPRRFSEFGNFPAFHRSFPPVQFGHFPRGDLRLAKVARCVR